MFSRIQTTSLLGCHRAFRYLSKNPPAQLPARSDKWFLFCVMHTVDISVTYRLFYPSTIVHKRLIPLGRPARIKRYFHQFQQYRITDLLPPWEKMMDIHRTYVCFNKNSGLVECK